MKTLAKISLLTFFLAPILVSAQDVPIIVSAQWLKEHQSDPNVVILHSGYLRLDYYLEHIEGAHFLWTSWLAPDSPDGSMNEPDLKEVKTQLRELGVSNDSHVVLYYGRNELTPTARMFLTLEHLGMKGRVSLLDGGLDQWKKEGFAVTDVVPEPKKGKFKPVVNNILVDKEYVRQRLNSPSSVIVDARFKRYYDGEPVGYPRNGHIQGAKNIPYNEMVGEGNLFKAPAELKAYFEGVASPEKEVVAYCFIGQTASVVYMAGRILGYNMKLYDGSMQEWSRLKDYPVEETPK